MKIDFKEIPAGNKGGEGQDKFELFSRDFLEKMGFEIIQHPSRGPDGKKDMIVKGSFTKRDKSILWLVSCKHKAHSNNSVTDSEEINILERLEGHQCQGFIGVYSTIPSSGLSEMLYKIRSKIKYELLDHERIESYIISKSDLHEIFWRYFEVSYEKHKHYLSDKQTNNMQNKEVELKKNIKPQKVKKSTKLLTKKNQSLTEEDVLRIAKTALIIIEVDKIKERFFVSEWEEGEPIIKELYKYYEHTNIAIADHVFNFLSHVAEDTRSGMTKNIAISVYSLSVDFFPYTEKKEDIPKIIELSNLCVETAFSMVYDAAIYVKDFDIIMYGLTILKYIYKKGNRPGMEILKAKVDAIYSELERNLTRTERPDLADALELVLLFKADRKKGTLVFPPLSEKLHMLVYPGR